MTELPSTKDLERLYKEKGHDALVWYAWRNALRALPVLGRLPLIEVWPQDTVQKVFATCRVLLVLAQWRSEPTVVKNAFTDTINAINNTTNIDYAPAAAYATASSVAAIKTAAGISVDYAYRSATSATTAISYTVHSAAIRADDSVAALAIAQSSPIVKSTSTAAISDYNKLLQSKDCFDWNSQPLWPPRKWLRFKNDEPIKILKLRKIFHQSLKSLELDFLADDLSNLWESKPLGSHAKNYLKNFNKHSDVDLNDPKALRRIIMDGEESEYIHAVRVLLLGPGGAGKSSLADRLQGKPIDTSKNLTQGVDYLNHQPLDLYNTFDYLNDEKKTLDVYLWDFGGQTIFHGLHRAFLHENCVYVLVVDSRHEQVPDEWLYQIRHLTKGKADTLIVTNWYEGCETKQNETQLLREFPDLLKPNNFFYFSCHKENSTGLKIFIEALVKACIDSQRQILKEILEVSKALKSSYQDKVFIDEDELYEIIKSKALSETKTVVEKLQQLGFLVSVNEGGEHYCLKPEWAVDNAYAVLYSEHLRTASGLVTSSTLQNIFDSIPKKYMHRLIDFLHARSLCCKIKNESMYFFPDAAPASEPPEVSQHLLLDNKLIIRFDLPYLPLGFHAQLVSSLFALKDISNVSDIWRHGFILRQERAQAVVHYLPRKSVLELILTGNIQDYGCILDNLLIHLKLILNNKEYSTYEKQIYPYVLFERYIFFIHSAEQLVDILKHIHSYEQLFREVRKMASGNTYNIQGDMTHNQGGDGSNFATKSQHVTQTSHVQHAEIDTDQCQQLAVVIDALLQKMGDLPAQNIIDVGRVKQALDKADSQPEARHLLGKVWNGLKQVLDVTKTTTEIGTFVLEHPGMVAGAISAATALIS